MGGGRPGEASATSSSARPGRAVAPDHRQGDAGDRGGQDHAHQPGLPRARRSTASSRRSPRGTWTWSTSARSRGPSTPTSNRNGTLHNNGMVATARLHHPALEQELGTLRRSSAPLTATGATSCGYRVDDGGQALAVGIRKLGLAHLKGLEKLAVYEIVDGAELDLGSPLGEPGEALGAAVDRCRRASRSTVGPSRLRRMVAPHARRKGLAAGTLARGEGHRPDLPHMRRPLAERPARAAARLGAARCATSTTSATRC